MTRYFVYKIVNKARISTLTFLILGTTVEQETSLKGIQIKRGEIKLSLYADHRGGYLHRKSQGIYIKMAGTNSMKFSKVKDPIETQKSIISIY